MKAEAQVPEFYLRDLDQEEVWAQIESFSSTTPFTILFRGDEEEFGYALVELRERFSQVYYALELTRKSQLQNFVKRLPHWVLPQLRVIPTAFDVNDRNTLSCKEIKRAVDFLRENGALAEPVPYRDYLKAETSSQEQIKWVSDSLGAPLVSVIIPTRNNTDFLLGVISHLLKQDIGFKNFEIIVVDDGGTDQALERLKILIGPSSGALRFKYIYNPRSQEEMTSFRAGECRNIGYKYSRGDWILFLDSDILVGADFLRQLLEEGKNADVIQCPRWHIFPEKSLTTFQVENVKEDDFYVEEPDYWGAFFATEDWASLDHAWRYTCTYCLAIRREALEKVGVFRRVFKSYGFEDTELGYRLYRQGFRFKLWKKKTYHLTPAKDKSPYYNVLFHKQILLSQTGKVFFLSTLDPDVFNLFKVYMQGEYPFLQVIYEFFKASRRKDRRRRSDGSVAQVSVERS